ncbi:MAG: glycine cleavage system aminomethyltransferase GcvT [Prevotella sp.]|nr:glycine cleavage system aminomethyltransferase GcvT [Prevotella sp.]
METKITCLHDKHVALGALMSPFAGFDMPIQYKDITTEHEAVRHHVGVFDVSHMGEVDICGHAAAHFVNHIFTNDVLPMKNGQILYGMMCYEDGGVVDDLLVYKRSDELYTLVINAANIDKDIAWLRENLNGWNARICPWDADAFGQLAVQGPEAERTMEEVLSLPCRELMFYTFKELPNPVVTDAPFIVSRTGYTGEDGFEIYGDKAFIRNCWDKLMAAGVQPCGLGCRDTLRFEVGLPLYGDELSEDISPVMAGLSMFVKLDKPEFIGREALAKQKAEGTQKKLVGLELQDKAIARHGCQVLQGEQVVGEVTTGYRSISTGKSVCMALIDTACAQQGTELKVQVRKKTFPAIVVKKRFYEKHYKKD